MGRVTKAQLQQKIAMLKEEKRQLGAENVTLTSEKAQLVEDKLNLLSENNKVLKVLFIYRVLSMRNQDDTCDKRGLHDLETAKKSFELNKVSLGIMQKNKHVDVSGQGRDINQLRNVGAACQQRKIDSETKATTVERPRGAQSKSQCHSPNRLSTGFDPLDFDKVPFDIWNSEKEWHDECPDWETLINQLEAEHKLSVLHGMCNAEDSRLKSSP